MNRCGSSSAALVLARAGHDVVVAERDDLTPAPDVEAAAATAFRASAPQLVQSHVVLALCRELLSSRLPDVYTDLLDAGVVEADLASQMAPTLVDRAARPGCARIPRVAGGGVRSPARSRRLLTERGPLDIVGGTLRCSPAAPELTS